MTFSMQLSRQVQTVYFIKHEVSMYHIYIHIYTYVYGYIYIYTYIHVYVRYILIYIIFIRPHLDYGDVIIDHAYNKSFHESLESLQYNASLAITRAIGGTSKQKLYQDLGLKSLQHRRWFSKLCISYQIFKIQSPRYLYESCYLFKRPLITQDSLEIYALFILNTISSKTLFSLM